MTCKPIVLSKSCLPFKSGTTNTGCHCSIHKKLHQQLTKKEVKNEPRRE